MNTIVAFFALFIACAFAFNAPGATRPARMVMLFGGKKPAAAPAAPAAKVGKGTANQGTYVPEGLTPEAYQKFLKEEEKKKAEKQKKFPKGKETLSLTGWLLQEKAKGLEGKDLLYKGHRMVKAKYDEWYTDENPV